MNHYEYRMVSAIVWGAAYAVASMNMELSMASELRKLGNTDAAVRSTKRASKILDQIQERRDFYDRKGED